MKIQKDKIQHALINFGIVAVVSLLWYPKGAIAIALIVSIAKEIYDEYKTNATGFDTQDLIADCIGIILGLLTFLIIMAKWFYNSKLAKWLTPLGTCHTITLGCVVLTEKSKDKVSQRLRNHENTHVKQFTELLIIGIVLYAVMALFDVSWWLIFPCLLLYYVWYGIEWLIRFIQCKFDWHEAYKAVAFEQEADAMEEKNENERLAFGFLRHYKAQDKHT